MSKAAKSTSRRAPSGLIASIQFDKLLSDAGKRPIAAKSAGVVGKWGTTSFTSLRSSHVNSIKSGSLKSSLVDGMSNYGSTENKPSPSQPSEAKTEPSAPKPRKFFKSRATDNQASANTTPLTIPDTTSFDQTFPPTKLQAKSMDKYNIPPPVEPAQTRTTRGRAKNTRSFTEDSDDEEYEVKKPKPSRKGKSKTAQPPPPPPVSQRVTRTKRKLEKIELEAENDEDWREQTVAPVKAYNRNSEKKEMETVSLNVPTTPEEHKPPIKLKIIRQNDKSAFVTSLSSDECEKKESDISSDNITDTTDTIDHRKSPEEPMEIPDVDEKVSLPEAPEVLSDPVAPPEDSPKAPEENDVQRFANPAPCESNGSEPHASLVETIPQQTQKKSSIFRSRTKASEVVKSEQSIGRKGLALYRHKWHEDDKKAGGSSENAGDSRVATTEGKSNAFGWNDDAEFNAAPEPSFGRAVVRNVKKAHQIQESGEFQEFNDDIEYLLDALQDRNPTATRCLSAMNLATKCMEPAFRLHLKSNSTLAMFFQALKDAPSKASVALCTSCIMFVLTQDRLNMDLDRDSLELMLNLLESDIGQQLDKGEAKELEKNKSKVRELCEEMVRKGHGAHLQLDNITAAQLAMETLLSLTSKKAGEWFKEELRVLGGLDHIIQTVTVCNASLTSSTGNWEKPRLDALTKVDRCLRVLENVTFQNDENQNYLMQFSNGVLVDATLKLLQFVSQEIAVYSSLNDSVAQLLSEALVNLMKVVMNLTHDSSCDSIGSGIYGGNPFTWDVVMTCLQETPRYVAEEKKFEIMTLSLGILINLVERSSENPKRLMTKTIAKNSSSCYAIEALIDIFIEKEESARLEEARTDAILDGKPADHASQLGETIVQGASEAASGSAAKSGEDAMEETVKKLLHKAGRHMEDSMIAAYVGLLVGYLVMNNKTYEKQVKNLLPDRKFAPMIGVLRKFYEFLKLTTNAVIGTRGLKNTMSVIKFMEASDQADLNGNDD